MPKRERWPERLNQRWRVVATAIAFSTFGAGGLLIRLLAFPLLQLLVHPSARRARAARLLVHHAFKAFIGWMRLLGILDYEIHGQEKLQRQGLLILANHPTLLDVVFLISLVPQADCVVKGALARNLFTRGPVRATQYLCNDSGTGLVEDCIASVQSGQNLVIFPEGTRTPVHGPMQLQRGAANIAVRGGCNITPVIIRCEPLSLTKGLPWWQVPRRPMHFTITVHDDWAVAPFLAAAHHEPALAARHLTQHLHDFFTVEASRHAGT